ncbi:MAG: peptidoglycan-binding protein [Candidatus Omnitrophica bacterium]|nr:peptidoglycan-binding protein [Candidatus Omnitrophota bacterium]MBI2173758.1 peptidoglycan-binding protein [Candidatus Omnitrophota bacterium]MBI3010108.1 peptidoglycan-binding protein [Candidatus Omnitrophota bacterium]
MKTVYAMVGLSMVVMAAGCGSTRTRQDWVRLQSQMNLLDERVSQLERTGSGNYAAAPMADPLSGELSAFATQGPKFSPSASQAIPAKPSTRQIQQALKNAGFYQGAIDGKMGPQTRSAVKEFQRIQGLTDDGVVGKRTWEKLSSYAELSTPGAESMVEGVK